MLAFLLQAGQLNGLTKSDCGAADVSPEIRWHSIGPAELAALHGRQQHLLSASMPKPIEPGARDTGSTDVERHWMTRRAC